MADIQSGLETYCLDCGGTGEEKQLVVSGAIMDTYLICQTCGGTGDAEFVVRELPGPLSAFDIVKS